ncbi:hypothetical protein N7462_009066 [Penicillium macrosclerotiorum]|uniref:uncharacterized protein n=1 Tax=Penicillium macrosclerotiorum TaxID=303699 RepID=UPI002548D804|nr:uncharacterized protein N7462_009066 [Penicillium macrosclerotiorum]KAJ5676169.1 hypothetical protein N7462_009066 [Penicillium macrosclerotiorum]
MLKETPLLLKTILWVCKSSLLYTNKSFEIWFRRHIAHRVVVLMDKNLELLQAILVFLAWKDIQFYVHGHDTSLFQLAIGIAGDLGLTNCPDIPELAFGSIVEDTARLRNDLRPQALHSSADRWAFLSKFSIIRVDGQKT